MNEVNVLLHAWETGATRFRKLDPNEFMEWERARRTDNNCMEEPQAVREYAILIGYRVR